MAGVLKAMYELPSWFDPGVFNGATLNHIVIFPANLDFCFEFEQDDKSIVLQAGEGVDLVSSDPDFREWERFEDGVRVPTHIGAIVGSQVVRARARDNRDLILTFACGFEIAVLGDNSHYECYLIRGAGELIVV